MEDLFRWIRQNQPQENLPEFLPLLERTLAILPPAGPLRSEIHRILQGHDFHWERVWKWPEIYRSLRSELALLMEELHLQAAALPASRWENARFRRFVRCRANPAALDHIQAELESAWENYMQRPLAPSEVTAESVAGHRLLVEGLAAWMEALELARLDPLGEEAVERAALGSRLLFTLQAFSKKLGEAGRTGPIGEL